mmetsp:Transcript_6573/g.12821  ORF Transcript_6573/g.12821 Transcript_6573/m.12821 type:complete len:376 (+) Transcript_6573:1770-2897(+)
MAALTDIANVPDSFQSEAITEHGVKNRTRRRRREERGFRGTFLHGMSSSTKADDGAISPKDVSLGASPEAVTTECIILDDASPAEEQSKPLSNSIEDVPTTSTAISNGPFMKEHQPTPPLAPDASDVIVIDDDGDDGDDGDDNNNSIPRKNKEASAPEESGGIASSSSEPSSESELPPEYAAINANAKVYVPKSKYNLSKDALYYSAPIRTPDAPRLEDEDGTHLCCELATLDRNAVDQFVMAMKKKPDTFWEDKNEAIGAFAFLLPKSIPPDHARHLYRNFSDNESMNCPCKVGKPLPISRREMDIMLYFIEQGKSSRDCHRYMPYRHDRSLRYVFDKVKKGYRNGAAGEMYMENVIVAVERIVSIETSTPSDV